jgi:hypothetical protein
MPGEDPDDTLIFWQTNECTAATPPADRADWVRIIRKTTPHKGVRVVLTTDGQGRWWVSVAEETPVGTGGYVPIEPIDHRAAVADALRKAGKPIRD